MRAALLAVLALIALAGGARSGGDWDRYVNAWYGYGIDIPPGFSPIVEATNSDGGVSRSADGQSQLSVWGANLVLDPLSSDVQGRIQSAADEGWQISYRKITGASASWSGERMGRIFYARAVVLCGDDQAGFFRIEYPAEQKDDFDAVVTRLVKGFKHTECS